MPAYEIEQDAMDQSYKRAWKSAPASFRKRAAKLKLIAKVDSVAYGVIELDEGMSTVATEEPEIDPMENAIEGVIEHRGCQQEDLIREIAQELQAPMREEMERDRASAIGRIACYLVKGRDGGNILARIHSLLHAIPRLAAITGFPSLRESSKACGASVQWIKIGRDKWCDILEIPIPVEGTKKPETKAKYRQHAKTKHWRKTKYTTNANHRNSNRTNN